MLIVVICWSDGVVFFWPWLLQWLLYSTQIYIFLIVLCKHWTGNHVRNVVYNYWMFSGREANVKHRYSARFRCSDTWHFLFFDSNAHVLFTIAKIKRNIFFIYWKSEFSPWWGTCVKVYCVISLFLFTENVLFNNSDTAEKLSSVFLVISGFQHVVRPIK